MLVTICFEITLAMLFWAFSSFLKDFYVLTYLINKLIENGRVSFSAEETVVNRS